MMLFFKPKKRDHEMNRAIEVSAGMGVGSIAGFLGGLLGGGNFIVPVLNWLGLCESGGGDDRARRCLFVVLGIPGSCERWRGG
jgi:hypothetical protein